MSVARRLPKLRRPSIRHAMSDSKLTIAVVDLNPARAAVVEDGLRAAGIRRVIVIPDTVDLMRRLAEGETHKVVIYHKKPKPDQKKQNVKV